MKYIETLREGEKLGDIYLCKSRQSALTKSGKSYENVILQDKTGTLDAKIWDPGSPGIGDLTTLDYVYVVGDVTSFPGFPAAFHQTRTRAEEGEYDPADYLPMSRKDIDEMYEELLKYMRKVKNPYLLKLAESFFVENEAFIRLFKKHSAAKSVHHGFVGGLLEHTLSVVKLCDFYADQYDFLNRDLLITAAMFHDIGKTKELSAFPANDYTDDGQLLGHIVIGVELVGLGIRRIPDFPKTSGQRAQALHRGSSRRAGIRFPEETGSRRGSSLNFADNTDARMETFREILTGSATTDEWLGYNRFVDSNVRRTTEF